MTKLISEGYIIISARIRDFRREAVIGPLDLCERLPVRGGVKRFNPRIRWRSIFTSHNGILYYFKAKIEVNMTVFLDVFPQFGASALVVIRQPTEVKIVSISRAKGLRTLCATFNSSPRWNPFPCSYYSDAVNPFACAPGIFTKYREQISVRLLNRIDIHIEVPCWIRKG